ncbi:MAG TPA: response regulator [Bryobacteraceae bacterium]|nr:response regulator [Bryobacteraceae bacterium]
MKLEAQRLRLLQDENMGSATLSGTRILVADDDAETRAWLRDALESAGCNIVEAGNGKEAMNLLTQESVDLCMTDLSMPEQEGIETIRLLRQEYPDLKIIAISGAFGPEFLRVSKILGAAATLQKPIRLQNLLETVQKLLARPA